MGQPEATPPRVTVATTGKNAELVETVPIRRSGNKAVSVISLGEQGPAPTILPELAPGDRLLISAEVEVTTDCKQRQSDCVATPYTYPPEVEARLLIADGPGRARESSRAKVLKTQRRMVTHDRHHDVFVFDDVPYEVPAGGLPWSGPTFVNVAIGARHSSARADHVVLIGQNDPGGEVGGDMSAISVVHSRPADIPRPGVIRETQRRAESIPVIKGESRVVYARELPDLRSGEQLVVKAEVVTSAARLDYPARGTVEVLLGDDPTRPEPGREARRVTATDGRICPRNDKNCLKAESPMTSAKVGVLRVTQNPRKPLHVIVVLQTGDPWQRAREGDQLKILKAGSLRIFRYGSELAG